MIVCASSDGTRNPFVSLWIIQESKIAKNRKAEKQRRSPFIAAIFKVLGGLRILFLCTVGIGSFIFVAMIVKDFVQVRALKKGEDKYSDGPRQHSESLPGHVQPTTSGMVNDLNEDSLAKGQFLQWFVHSNVNAEKRSLKLRKMTDQL